MKIIEIILYLFEFFKLFCFGNKYGKSFKCNSNFMEISLQGYGSGGGVFKVLSIKDNKVYAIKKIPYYSADRKKIMKESKLLLKLKSEFVVRCYELWTENNYITNDIGFPNSVSYSSGMTMFSDPSKRHLLHIQMEFCPLTLDEIIKAIISSTVTGYFVMSELFVELLECVNYLHSRKPQVIHRDLKPKNIMITYGKTGHFVKLADFGLSTLHEFDKQSHTSSTGTMEYMAPEVQMSRDYNTKADIYSLGICVQKMFDFNINSPKKHALFTDNYKVLEQIVIDMLSCRTCERPSCSQLLNRKSEWCLTKQTLFNDETIRNLFDKSSSIQSIEENFEELFIKSKLNFKA